ncbi:MAG: peptidoglycan DD-metalloendopeptidase family protein [Pyrinomonadaceae bacterium]|nr:peptidoglycan DD-metalloendopeptidase family protein [Pyrinomonadaceae bacterium]
MANRIRSRILMAFGAFVLCLALLIWILSARSNQDEARPSSQSGATPSASTLPSTTSSQPTPPAAAPEITPLTSVEASPAPSLEQSENNTAQPPAPTNASGNTSTTAPAVPPNAATLLIPVAGVRPEHLRDTFQESRSEGRVHDAIDIPAARGTPVLAAADGRIVKFFNSERGGITIYQLSVDEKLVYYYAHLERYADGLKEGHFARRGEVIAYVGDTGNAGPGNYHLHFSVATITDPKRYWAGTNVNPYPLLRGQP